MGGGEAAGIAVSPASAASPASWGGPAASIEACRQSANCCVSFLEISGSKPRESCAAAPVRVMSACIFTVVAPSSVGSSHDVTLAVAAPLPFCSMPLAARTTRCAASSRSCIVTCPANESFTGPKAMFTLPFQFVSSTVSVSSAPGMHGATFSTSSRYAQTTSAGRATVNSFSISISAGPPGVSVHRTGRTARGLPRFSLG